MADQQHAHTQRQQWLAALKASRSAQSRAGFQQGAKSIAPNKAAGRKGGIRRQGSKRA
jgi:hypothetical protein